MRRLFLYIGFLCIVGIAIFFLSHPVAQETVFTPAPLEDIIAGASVLLASMVMFPVFLASVLELLEFYGKIDAGQADQIQILANIGLYLACFVAVLLGKTHLLSALDYYLGGITPILVALLALLTGGIHSIIQTRRYQNHIRLLYPIRKNAIAQQVKKDFRR